MAVWESVMARCRERLRKVPWQGWFMGVQLVKRDWRSLSLGDNRSFFNYQILDVNFVKPFLSEQSHPFENTLNSVRK